VGWPLLPGHVGAAKAVFMTLVVLHCSIYNALHVNSGMQHMLRLCALWLL
jgi:hypothetical protein